MKRVLISILCLTLLCGCVNNTNTKDTQKPTVVATIFPLYDFARAIGGNNINIKMLIRPGSEVHSYDPLPSDMSSVYNSDLFLYIGGESDTWVNTLLNSTDINSLALIDSVKPAHQEHANRSHNHQDEHIWTSPHNAVLMLKSICKRLCDIDPKSTDIYKENCNTYIAKINQASKTMSNMVSTLENPFILVADRFPFVYLAEQYGIEYESAFDGCAVNTDISLKTMARLTETIKSKNINTVFCTELSNKNVANALQEELGVEIIELHSAHNVTLEDFNNATTYIDILQRNITALERGLVS